MAGAELEQYEDPDAPGESVELTPQQIGALEKLEALGAAPRAPDEKYNSDAQIRAYQMVAEGRLGGPGRGQGRKSQKDRVSKALAARNRRKIAKLDAVINSALDDDNIRVAMDAVKLVHQIEQDEAKQTLREEQADDEELDKEGLVLALIQQFSNPQVEAAVRARQDIIDLPAASVREVNQDDDEFDEATVVDGDDNGGSPAVPARPRVFRRKPVEARGKPAPRDAGKRKNPWKEAARGRPAD